MILFVTANENEKEAFEKRFFRMGVKHVMGKEYYLGRFGNYESAYIHIEEQGVTNAAATPLVGEVIRKERPLAVVMVGIAFGIDESKQKLGDILVSQYILPYDDEKVLETSSKYKEPPVRAGFNLLNAFRDSKDWIGRPYAFSESNIIIGAILTGSKLVNNYDFRRKLLTDFSEYSPIGGEMEANGIYNECRKFSVPEWIIIKGICDWGYKKDNPKKKVTRNLHRL